MPIDPELEELFGDDDEPAPKRPAQREFKGKPLSAGRPEKVHDVSEQQVVKRLNRPVSASFLGNCLDIDRRTVAKRLIDCPPVGYAGGNRALYDFRQALPFIVQRPMSEKDLEAAIRRLDSSSLPRGLSKDIWDAKLKAQKWRQNAGELWPTDKVLEILGEAFQRLKTSTQLWIDQIADNHALPEKARQELTVLVDALQADLHRTLCEMPKEAQTPSQLSEENDFDDVSDA